MTPSNSSTPNADAAHTGASSDTRRTVPHGLSPTTIFHSAAGSGSSETRAPGYADAVSLGAYLKFVNVVGRFVLASFDLFADNSFFRFQFSRVEVRVEHHVGQDLDAVIGIV